jgi:hypothetical protein
MRVGLSGWSYGAEVTELVLTRSNLPFAAASKVDGGNGHYGADRLWTHAELSNIRAPFLVESHGLEITESGPFAEQLAAPGRPVEILWFGTAPHATITPQHRWRAMTVHGDWFRFWLQNYEDPDPAKESQYARWRKLRTKTATP